MKLGLRSRNIDKEKQGVGVADCTDYADTLIMIASETGFVMFVEVV